MDDITKDERERKLKDARETISATDIPSTGWYSTAVRHARAFLSKVKRTEDLEAQLSTVLQRESATQARHDARVEELERENERLTLERDMSRENFDKLAGWSADQAATLSAWLEKLEAALRDANELIWRRLNDSDQEVDAMHHRISAALTPTDGKED